jgi:hypothetical protein
MFFQMELSISPAEFSWWIKLEQVSVIVAFQLVLAKLAEERLFLIDETDILYLGIEPT